LIGLPLPDPEPYWQHRSVSGRREVANNYHLFTLILIPDFKECSFVFTFVSTYLVGYVLELPTFYLDTAFLKLFINNAVLRIWNDYPKSEIFHPGSVSKNLSFVFLTQKLFPSSRKKLSWMFIPDQEFFPTRIQGSKKALTNR